MNVLFTQPKWDNWVECIYKLDNSYILNITNNTKIDEFISYIKKNSIKIFIPLELPDIQFTITHRKKIERYVPYIICCKRFSSVAVLDDKCEFANFMTKNNLNHLVPETYMNSGIKYCDIVFPCIKKLHNMYGGIGTRIYKNESDYLIDTDYNKKLGKYIIQECIFGKTEYAGNFYIKDGIIKLAIYYEGMRNELLYIKYGPFQTKKKISLDLNTEFEQILKIINYTGFMNVDFKLVNERPIIFECNCRFGGGNIADITDLKAMIDACSK